MSDPIRPDEEVAGELLELLRADQPDPPGNLAEKTKQKVRASITSRDLIDLTTIVFVLRFCAPLMDLVAALFGVESQDQRGSHD
ncbi:MAG: hypothetical protein AAF430_12175 [Myxococcota bacterium]